MVSHEKCSAGGEHNFDDGGESDFFNSDIMRSFNCSKCNEVSQNEMLVRDSCWEYHDCKENVCDGSNDGHNWESNGHDYSSPDEYFQDKCRNCDGTRQEWYRHKYTTYNGENGQEFHRHSA